MFNQILKQLNKLNEEEFDFEDIEIEMNYLDNILDRATQNPDGSYDVKGDVNLSDKNLTRLPIKFRHVSGDFYCHDNKLTSLEGAPKEVGGYFYCQHNPVSEEELKQTIDRDYL